MSCDCTSEQCRCEVIEEGREWGHSDDGLLYRSGGYVTIAPLHRSAGKCTVSLPREKCLKDPEGRVLPVYS